MRIELPEDEFFEDKYIDIEIGKEHKFRIYVELSRDDDPWYAEIVHSRNGKTIKGYAFDASELEKLIPKKLDDPSYFSNDPLCPNCRTYMIYNFEYCPKCGQRIDYSHK